MSQKSALTFNQLNENAALIMELSFVVRARIIEAADTMLHLNVGMIRPSAVRTFWPTYQDETIGGHSLGYGNNGSNIRYVPSSKAISRAEEVLYYWVPEYVHDIERRLILSQYAMCMAAPKKVGSFRSFCEKTGRVRRTAERRLDAQIIDLAAIIWKKAQSLQCPDWSRVSPMLPKSGIDLGKMATVMHWMSEGAKPIHNPEMQEAA
ncbi:hypothetical protein [Pseudochrobactrum sp. XF203]|uniref:hypothetical protein n=1 Tax=Pseudochrobactrum sp. XF203 TaxID=2879116 RepID=UPI001CE395C2|nr:hypothetical protein [Pseudochrobactrum sp. XF203]UCA47607.1 hypothetical protein LDL70_16255 [Pseudochrobactrum sp. XF203]